MSQTKLEVLVAFSGGAATSGLQMLRQNTDQLKASLEKVRLSQKLATDLLAAKSKFNEIAKSGRYGQEAVKAVTAEVATLSARAREAGLNVGKLRGELRGMKLQQAGINMQMRGQSWREKGQGMRADAKSKIVEVATSAYALFKPLNVAAAYEDVVKDIAITGDMTRKEEAELAKSIRGLAVKYNQQQEAVADSMKKLVETGMEKSKAEATTPLLAKTATATRADTGDAAKMARSFDLLEVRDMELAFNQAAKAGKSGSFELANMAKWFPELGGYMKELGVKGNEAVVSMAARMQIATRTAGGNDEAANNFKNFLSKLTSQDTIKDFKKKAGIDLIPTLQAAARQGMDPIAAGVDLVMKHVATKAPEAAKELKKVAAEVAAIKDPIERQAELERRQGMIKKLGDRAGLGELFQDMQAVSYLLAEMQNQEELKRLQADVKTGANADGRMVIDADFERRAEGMSEKLKSLKIAGTELGIAYGNALIPVVEMLVPWLKKGAEGLTAFTEKYPALSRLAVVAVTGASAMTILGVAGKFMLGGLLSWAGGIATVAGWLMRMRVAGQVAAGFGRIAAAASDLRGFGVAALRLGASLSGPLLTGLRAVGLALLGIPGIGWITAALLVVGALVWKYWGPIKSFVKGLWDGLKSGLSAAAAAVRPGMQSLGKVLSGLWGGLKGAASAVWAALKPLGGVIVAAFAPFRPVLAPVIGLVRRAWTWFTELITPIRAAGPNSQAMGKAVGEALGKIIAKGAELLGYFAGLPGKFLKFGGDIVTGLLEGLQSKWELLKSKVGAMADMVSGVFQQKQKIHSPSRVFMGFGRNIGEGAALGIDQSISGVRAAIGAMSAAITLAFAPAPLLAQPVLPPMHTTQPAASHQVPPLVPRMAPMATPQVPDAAAVVRGQWTLPQIPQQTLQLLPALARLPVIGPMLQPLLPRMASMATPQVPDATAAVRGQWALPQIPQQALQLLPALARLPVIGPMLQPLLPRMAPMATPQAPDATAAVRGQWALPQIPQQALQLLPALARLPVIGPMLQPLLPRMAPMATPQVPDATAVVRGQWTLPQIPQQALQLLPALARLPVIGPMLQPLLPRMAPMATPQVPDAAAVVRGQWTLPQIPQQTLQLLPALARLPVIGPMLQPLLPRMAPMATPQVPDATAAVRGQWTLPQIPQQALQLLPALARLPVIGPMLQPLLPRMAPMATPQVPDATAAVRGQWTLPQIPQQALQLPAALATAPQPPSRLEQLLRSAHAVASTPTAPGQAAAANITVHYAPSITIQDQGNAQATGTAVQTALITNQRDLERMLQRILEERARRSIR